MLHIGTPKTGTTALQHALGDRASLLSQNGILYPTDWGRNHIRLVLLGARPKLACSLAERLGIAPEDVNAENDALLAQLEVLMKGHESCVMSSEFLYELFWPEELVRLRDALRSIFEKIRIAIYFRPQDAMFSAEVSQRVKAGAADPEEILRYNPNRYDYLGRLRTWAEVFGTEAINALPFAEALVHPLGTPGAFCDHFGLLVPGLQARQVNQSLDTVKLAILWRLGREIRSHKGSREIRNAAAAALEAFPEIGAHWRPSPELQAEIIARHAEDNAILSRDFLDEVPLPLEPVRDTSRIAWDTIPDFPPDIADALALSLTEALSKTGLAPGDISNILAKTLGRSRL